MAETTATAAAKTKAKTFKQIATFQNTLIREAFQRAAMRLHVRSEKIIADVIQGHVVPLDQYTIVTANHPFAEASEAVKNLRFRFHDYIAEYSGENITLTGGIETGRFANAVKRAAERADDQLTKLAAAAEAMLKEDKAEAMTETSFTVNATKLGLTIDNGHNTLIGQAEVNDSNNDIRSQMKYLNALCKFRARYLYAGYRIWCNVEQSTIVFKSVDFTQCEEKPAPRSPTVVAAAAATPPSALSAAAPMRKSGIAVGRGGLGRGARQ